jgi:hypothetical protein
MKILISILLVSIVVVLHSASSAYGQIYDPTIGQAEKVGAQQDSANKTDLRKGMRQRIIAYQFKPDFTSLDSIEIDTTLKRFQIFYKPVSDRALNVFLGNHGLPYEPVIYSNRPSHYSDFLFSQPIEYNFHQPEEMVYYKTWSPFTEFTYYTGGPKSNQEQKLNIIHTQNINEKVNVGFLGDLNYSDGRFINQRARSNAFTLFSGYKGNRYSIYGSLSLDSYKSQENGGIRTDSLYLAGDDESGIPVNLENASSVIKRKSVFLYQRLYLTGSSKTDTLHQNSKWNEVVSIIHQLKYERYGRDFNDNLTTVSGTGHIDQDYYLNTDTTTNFNRDLTDDSTFFRRFENTFQMAINTSQVLKVPAELRFGIKNQLDKYKYGPQDTTSLKNGVPMQGKTSNNNAFTGSLANRFSKTLNFGASAEYYFTGYKGGDFEINGDIEQSIKHNFIMTLSGKIAFTKPSYFVKEYESNHFNWNNDFNRQKISSVHLGLYHKKLKLSIDGQIDYINNYFYFGTDGKPAHSGSFSVQTVTLNKLIDWGIFHTDFRLTGQLSGDKTSISIPEFTGFNSTYLEFTFFKVLHVQYGWDLFYNSLFYADAYMPETGVFYSQKNIKVGNYPYTDMFLNIKLKRVRFFLKYDRFNAVFPNTRDFYLPHYPYNPGMLKYGLSWTFYD